MAGIIGAATVSLIGLGGGSGAEAGAGASDLAVRGSELGSYPFFGADLIDRLIVKLNPVVFGIGIPLFGGGLEPTTLALTDSKAYVSGHLVLHYTVKT